MSDKKKLFKAKVIVHGEVEEVPVWAVSIDEALEAVDAEYGEDAVLRLRPVVAV